MRDYVITLEGNIVIISAWAKIYDILIGILFFRPG